MNYKITLSLQVHAHAKEFKVGGLWEEPNWTVEFNYSLCPGSLEYQCPHCVPGARSGSFVCPVVIIATNEGGYNTTGLCLLCVLEQLGGTIIEQGEAVK